MAIETICMGCARKLRVGDEFAGRRARCPHCKTIYTVPAVPGSLDASIPAVEGTDDKWLLRSKDGAVYGPVPKSELDDWAREGRLDAASQVRTEREQTWRQATDIYPVLLPTAASNDVPLSSEPTFSTPATNPYTAPRAAGRMRRPFRPHRGGMILLIGLLGFVCCQIFSIAAWVMGHTDMKEINAGRMDPAGRGLTQAGMIIGIVGTLFMVLGIGFQIVMVLIMIISDR